MKKLNKLPRVLLVGRTNVGKSTLFNRLTNRTKSIVFDCQGVTRDSLHEPITWNDTTFDLIDTGGLILTKNQDAIASEVKQHVLDQLNAADIFLFVCDVKNGITSQDQQIARILHKVGKHLILLLNKADNSRKCEENLPDFYTLGIETIMPISAIHGLGMAQLLEYITKILGKTTYVEEESDYKVVIVGKPNVGKSSLMNYLIKQERAIVSDVAGTTREALSEKINFYQKTIQLTDTAGIRRKPKIHDNLEELMVKSSFKSIAEADCVLLMIDASAGRLSDQELKLLFYAFEKKKSIILLFNKIDLVDNFAKESLNYNLAEYAFILKRIIQLSISCKTGKNIGIILKEIEKIWQRQQQTFNSTDVNDLVHSYLLKKPMYHKRNALKLFKIRHVKGNVPTFVLHVNYPQWFGPTQLGFIENILRKHYDLKGCPLQFSIKKV